MLYGIESNIWVGHVRTLNVLHWLLRGTASRWWGYKSFIAENYTIASVITTNKNQFNNRNEHGRNIKQTINILISFYFVSHLLFWRESNGFQTSYVLSWIFSWSTYSSAPQRMTKSQERNACSATSFISCPATHWWPFTPGARHREKRE